MEKQEPTFTPSQSDSESESDVDVNGVESNEHVDGLDKVHHEQELKLNAEASKEIHPLSPKWVLWLWIGNRDNKDWTDCLEEQCTIGTIEDFIALKHRILPPSRLSSQQLNYMIFKEGIAPAWEDPLNSTGGSIDILLPPQHQHTLLDRYWFAVLVAALGGDFKGSNDQICGVCLRARYRGYAISVWIRNASEHKVYGPIMELLEEKLNIGNDPSIHIRINKHGQQQECNSSNNFKRGNERMPMNFAK